MEGGCDEKGMDRGSGWREAMTRRGWREAVDGEKEREESVPVRPAGGSCGQVGVVSLVPLMAVLVTFSLSFPSKVVALIFRKHQGSKLCHKRWFVSGK